MNKHIIFIFSLFISLSGLGLSQTNNNGTQTNPNDPNNQNNQGDQRGRRGFWEANLAGGNYMVALSRVTSVSRHKYVLDNAVIVDEVTVDTDGQSLVRFYFISPITAAGPNSNATTLLDGVVEKLNNTASERGSSVQDMVIKKYPMTTHSKTIEYRLLSEAQLTALYQSVKTAWLNGEGRVFNGQ